MISLMRCTVSSDGEEIADWANATIVASGESPNATIAISAPDAKDRKFRRVERVLHASLKGSGRNWEIRGISETLTDTIGVAPDDAHVTYQVLSVGGCQGCP